MRALSIVGAFESTYQPAHDRDVVETTGHAERWREDLDLLAGAGVRRLRYPVRWHRVEARPGELDWRHTDEVLGHMRASGLRPIVDLVHHTSYPRWLDAGFADRRFGEAYLRYVEAFCARYPWVEAYTLFNEPFSTLFLAGHEGLWPPYLHGVHGFVNLCRNVLPALTEACRVAERLLPTATHVWVDTCEHHTGRDPWGLQYAEYANDRRFFVLDAVLGRLDDGFRRPFVREVVHEGGGALLDLDPGHVDVVGLDYYAHCQWSFAAGGMGNRIPSPDPLPLHEQVALYAERYGRTVSLTETNIRGAPSDRATWFKYVLEQCERAVAAGVDLDGVCWFPSIDSADWGSLLYRCEGELDPVGAWSIAPDLERVPTSMSASLSAAASGASSADLPAYELQEPARSWLAGYRSQMAHWDWRPPPAHEVVVEPELYDFELGIRDA